MVLMSREGDPCHIAKGGRPGPRDARARPRRAEGSRVAELPEAPAAQQLRPRAGSPAGLDEQLGRQPSPSTGPGLPRAWPLRPALQAAFIDSGFSFRHLKADKEREC